MQDDTGSAGGGDRGLRASTAASERRADMPEYGAVYRYGAGEVIVPKSRRDEALKSKNERKKFASELMTARTMAKAGYKITFTSKGAGTHDVYCNGVPADIKRLSSANNIARHARHAINSQGAKIVIFEFTKTTPRITSEIHDLTKKGIHGKYFYTDERKVRDF